MAGRGGAGRVEDRWESNASEDRGAHSVIDTIQWLRVKQR